MQDHLFLPLICAFNFQPFTYTHATWLDQVCPIPVVDDPGPRARCRRHFPGLNPLVQALNFPLEPGPFGNFNQVKPGNPVNRALAFPFPAKSLGEGTFLAIP